MIKKQERIKKIVEMAKSLIGAPYKYGAYLNASKSKLQPKEFDCSSFIQHIYQQAGVEMPRSSILQASRGKEIKNSKDLTAGDLIFFEGTKGHYAHKVFKDRKIYIGHVALYIGDEKIVHARESRGAIAGQKLSSLTKNKDYSIVLIKRII